MHITIEKIKGALHNVIDPNTEKDLISSNSARNIRLEGNDVLFDIELDYLSRSQSKLIRDTASAEVSKLSGVNRVIPHVYSKIKPHAVQQGIKILSNIKNIIAVSSGKGGVGKSTTAANLALALVSEGARVGILDADIYGPSQPLIMGVSECRPETKDGKTMEPLESHGVQISSIGFMVKPDEPTVWRGPIVTKALQQLLFQTNWRNLDYLIVDMPPGTGDIQLTLSQKFPVTGAIIVTTPQDVALLDARKGLKMFEMVDIPILGIIENMSTHICSNCGLTEAVFGKNGGAKMCTDYGIEFLGALPLAMSIREQTDLGTPIVAFDPKGEISCTYKEIAFRVSLEISKKASDTTSKFPTIVIKST